MELCKTSGMEAEYLAFLAALANLSGSWMVGTKLKPWSAHSSTEGIWKFTLGSVNAAYAMINEVPILVLAESGFGSPVLIRSLHDKGCTEFVIRHNLQKDPPQSWLEIARKWGSKATPLKSKRESVTVSERRTLREVPGLKEPVRTVYEVNKVNHKKAQQPLVPEVRVCVLWPSLRIDWERGISEQSHAEFKS